MKCYKCDKELPSQVTLTAGPIPSITVHDAHSWRMINPAPCAAAGLGTTQMVPVCVACDPYPLWYIPYNGTARAAA